MWIFLKLSKNSLKQRMILFIPVINVFNHLLEGKFSEKNSSRVQTDEKLRTQRKWDKECKMFLLWVMIKYFQARGKTQVDPVSIQLFIIIRVQKNGKN